MDPSLFLAFSVGATVISLGAIVWATIYARSSSPARLAALERNVLTSVQTLSVEVSDVKREMRAVMEEAQELFDRANLARKRAYAQNKRAEVLEQKDEPEQIDPNTLSAADRRRYELHLVEQRLNG